MRYISILLLIIPASLMAQYQCVDGRYMQDPLFSAADIWISPNVLYASAYDQNGVLRDLMLDVYQPATTVDPLEARPLVIMVHGGGLLGGDKGSQLSVFLCTELAKRGYVAASVNYRLGWQQLGTCNGDTASLSRARYRAQQDVHAAIRFLEEKSGEYLIDTNYIFMAGSSVGATLSLLAAFSSEEDYDPMLVEELGVLDSNGNPYADHDRAIAGVFGTGIGMDKPWLLDRNDTPVMCFHGTCDFTVPYVEGPLFYCYEPVQYINFYGSRYLADHMRETGHPYRIYTNERGGHDAVDSLTLLEQAIPFLRSVLCEEPESKEIYEFHVDGCIVNRMDSVELDIHPNPVQEVLSVTIGSGSTGTAVIEIFNSIGQQVLYYEEAFYAPVREMEIILPPAMEERGIYFLRVRIQESVGMETFMKW